MMAMPFSVSTSLKLALTLAAFIFFFFSFLPPKSDGLVLSRSGREGKDEMKSLEEKMKIGSRPPGCENKCMSCRPCMAAAVVPVHRMKRKAGFKAMASSREEEDSYYLLSWKCQCGNKIYQP